MKMRHPEVRIQPHLPSVKKKKKKFKWYENEAS